ncbi:membrane protein [Bacteroidales bacterium]|nr:membrane protein [Bacteroidales bacterium]
MNKQQSLFKSFLPHIGALAFFFVIVIIYFNPIFQGKILQQGDIQNFSGMVKELLDYGKSSGWTGSMFSGMPSYHISGYETGIDFIGSFKGLYERFYNNSVGPIFLMLITSYIFFLILGARPLLAVMGAVGITFSSYNPIIISAGHVTKAWALAYTPLILGGMVWIFRQKYLSGFILFSFGLALQIVSNHLQITYYTGLFCAILFLGYIFHCIKTKEYKILAKSLGVLLLGLALAVLSNISGLYTNYESGQESMRGKAELSSVETGDAPTSTGLDIDYAFAWSYGKTETLSLLIPNIMGGSSGYALGKDSHLYKELKANGQNLGKEVRANTYWGDQPFTSGPIYFGAVICFLFVLAFFLINHPYKWCLLGAAIFFIMLSWGRNLAWFNEFLFYNLPMYSKFRTPSMSLVIPGFIFPIMAVMALMQLAKGEISQIKLKKALLYSLSIVGGICAILWVLPSLFFDFSSINDAKMQAPDWYLDALILDREALLRADAFRSLVFVVLSSALIFWYMKSKNKAKTMVYISSCFLVLVLCDLWQVDKRYLNDDNFMTKKAHAASSFQPSAADNEILKDKSLSYRVLNLNNPFAESGTSYFHKSIGGYHAAKLRRYQDLIDRRLNLEMGIFIDALNNNPTQESILMALQKCSSLNMLNTKYIIYNPAQAPIENPFRLGNAWFVDDYQLVDSPDQEIEALNTINIAKTAVINKLFAANVEGLVLSPDSTAHIEMSFYAPDMVEYKSSSQKDGFVVLSEIYYPYGWKATIDGKPVPINCVNWTLRGLVIPAGEHEIKLVFDPDEVRTFGYIGTFFSGLLLALVLGYFVFCMYRRLK